MDTEKLTDLQIIEEICALAHKHEIQYWLDRPETDVEKLRKILFLARELRARKMQQTNRL